MLSRHNKALIIGGIIALLLWKGEYMIPRGIRNNNPLNIRKTAIKWDGKIDGQDKSFETFTNPEYGIRAAAKLLLNYQAYHGLNTVEQIINRFAPPSENDSNSYADHVANEIGVEVDQPIKVEDHLYTMLKTMIVHENGTNPYSQGQILNGIAMV